ncbi:MAG: hypothetical protein EOP48_08810 [Sphingobacteriales bacterium]|nr:MAG: hypothetical protein EOP48_08810 [Sphingobacteriales bacterium]
MNIYIAIVMLISVALTDCNTSTSQGKQKNVNSEGHIVLDIKMFSDVDSSGFATKTIGGNDSIFLSAHRTMYLYYGRLIDIVENKNYANGIYTKTDTLSYDFYDLTTQKFIHFDKFAVSAKILKTGKMSESGSFSKMPQFDPMNGVPDSIWQVTDTTINGKNIGIVSFIYQDTTDTVGIELARKAKFWVDYNIRHFPLQLSYILSNKLNGSFVYKMQQPAPDGSVVMVTTLNYVPKKLSDTVVRIFNRWTQIASEER